MGLKQTVPKIVFANTRNDLKWPTMNNKRPTTSTKRREMTCNEQETTWNEQKTTWNDLQQARNDPQRADLEIILQYGKIGSFL